MQHTLTDTPGAAIAVQQPLSEHQFDALMAPLALWQETSCVAVAVSGGPDSLALALCVQRWAKAHSKSMKAFIVDHALRTESAEEAQKTRQCLAVLGIEAEVLVWQHEPVVSRLHMMARNARYELLGGACREQGIRHLLLAHQREDQAETILMRLAKGTGVDGLSGMSATRPMDDIYLLRPLLSVSKEQLIATCQAAGLDFIIDPSNVSEQFARGRLRKVLPLLAEEGLTVDRLCEVGERASEAKAALDYYMLRFLHEATQCDRAGALYYNRLQLASVPYAIAERAVIAALNAVNPTPYAPERASLAPVMQDLRSEQDMPTRTLQGCLISQTPTRITFIRELSSIVDSVPVRKGTPILWDGRWKIFVSGEKNLEDCFIRALGNPPHDVVDNLYPKLRDQIPQGRIRAALPALWSGSSLVAIPNLMPVDKLNETYAELIYPWPPIP